MDFQLVQNVIAVVFIVVVMLIALMLSAFGRGGERVVGFGIVIGVVGMAIAVLFLA